MKTDYRKLSEKELNEKLGEIEFRIIRASNRNFVHKKEQPENHSMLRREAARIKTEFRRRELMLPPRTPPKSSSKPDIAMRGA